MMSQKGDQYMHEINRLEGERDYWRRMHAKVDAELVTLRNCVGDLRATNDTSLEVIRAREEHVEQLRVSLEERTLQHKVQHENALRLLKECEAKEVEIQRIYENQKTAIQERDEARRAARQLYDLWPVEFWATLNGVVESFPWIEE